MALSILAYAAEHEPLVREFNGRMGAHGTTWGFYDQATPGWLPQGSSPNAWRDFFLALDETPAVRGAYCLKHQLFLARGEPTWAASIQGPVSEGLVDQKFGTVALHLIRDMQQRQARLFAWGASEKLLGVLKRMKWVEVQTPLALHVVNAGRFLRMNRFLRKNRKINAALDLLAATGAGALAIGLGQIAQSLRAGGAGSAPTVIEAARFGDWADEIWNAARGAYAFIAVRDSATMNALLPAKGWPEAAILRVQRGGTDIGWAAVRATQLKGDGRFGDLRVGSVVDSLAIPGQEPAVLKAATRHLRRAGVDVIVANYASEVWIRAFKAAGFLVSPNRRILVMSPALADAVGSADGGLHLTPLDGDGPLGL